jgi:hypothetical protein
MPGMTIARLASPAAWVHVRCVPAVAAVINHQHDNRDQEDAQ